MTEYSLAKAKYASIGIDTDAVIENLKKDLYEKLF